MPANTTEIEKSQWDAADDLRANSKLKSSEYAMPVLGLIFLRRLVFITLSVLMALQVIRVFMATLVYVSRRAVSVFRLYPAG